MFALSQLSMAIVLCFGNLVLANNPLTATLDTILHRRCAVVTGGDFACPCTRLRLRSPYTILNKVVVWQS